MYTTKEELIKAVQEVPGKIISNQKLLSMGVENRSYWFRRRKKNKIAFFKGKRGIIFYPKIAIIRWVNLNYKPKEEQKHLPEQRHTLTVGKVSIWKKFKLLVGVKN